MQDAGYTIDYVSPKGGIVPIDPRSLEDKFVSDQTKEIYESKEFSNVLMNSESVQNINADDYIAIYYTGGHGVVYDFPNDEKLQEVAQDIYANNGYITSVCHGVAGLLNIKDSEGRFLIEGKDITGFTNMEEKLSGKTSLVPFRTEDEVKNRKANFKKKMPFTSYAIEDTRIITGQNPMSGHAVAELLIKELNK